MAARTSGPEVRHGVDRAAALPQVVVVIPVYNHGRTVARVALDAFALGYPVIVVDDGSTDQTAEQVARLAGSHGHCAIEVVRHPRNRGKAAALATGFARAVARGASHVVTIDADGQLDPHDIPKLVQESMGYPRALILGSRPDRIGGQPARCGIGRRYASLGVLAQTGLRIRDTQCGLRAYPLELIGQVACRGARYAFEAEVIARAAWAGFEVREVPVGCRYFTHEARVSHWQPWRDSLRQLGVHARLLLRAMAPWPQGRTTPPPPPTSRLESLARWLNPFRAMREIRAQEIGDLELAAGLALGALIGATPFYGLHTAMSLYTAWRLHLHPAPIVLGSQVSAPPWGLALAGVSIALGHVMLTGSVPDPSGFTLAELPSFQVQALSAWLLGSMLVGVIVASIAFAAGLALARLIRPAHPVVPRVDRARGAVRVDPGAGMRGPSPGVSQ